jgi:hypothetical protein
MYRQQGFIFSDETAGKIFQQGILVEEAHGRTMWAPADGLCQFRLVPVQRTQFNGYRTASVT